MALKPDAAFRKDRTNAAADVMQHRHFAVIAGIIAGMQGDWSKQAHAHIAHRFANELASTNPRFDRARFLKACGV